MQKLSIKHEDLLVYSPYTGLPFLVDGNANQYDPSLIYIYFEEIAVFEYIKPGFEHVKKLNEPENGADYIDLVIELDDDIVGGNIYIAYVNI